MTTNTTKNVITSIDELVKFSITNTCPFCSAEANELIVALSRPGVHPTKIHFDTDCEHSHGPMASTVTKVTGGAQ
jgi:hypothetical protein